MVVIAREGGECLNLTIARFVDACVVDRVGAAGR
jgi:hypothetical protein